MSKKDDARLVDVSCGSRVAGEASQVAVLGCAVRGSRVARVEFMFIRDIASLAAAALKKCEWPVHLHSF